MQTSGLFVRHILSQRNVHHVAFFITDTALCHVVSALVITKWSVSQVTVSFVLVIALIAVCTALAISHILVTLDRFIQTISLSVQSRNILKLQSVIDVQLLNVVLTPLHHVI